MTQSLTQGITAQEPRKIILFSAKLHASLAAEQFRTNTRSLPFFREPLPFPAQHLRNPGRMRFPQIAKGTGVTIIGAGRRSAVSFTA